MYIRNSQKNIVSIQRSPPTKGLEYSTEYRDAAIHISYYSITCQKIHLSQKNNGCIKLSKLYKAYTFPKKDGRHNVQNVPWMKETL